MTVAEYKQAIIESTGIPEKLLDGETPEEILASAKAILAYKKQEESRRQKTTGEQFSEWLHTVQGDEEKDTAKEAITTLAEAARVNAGGYPIVADGGNPYINGASMPDPRTPQEQFTEWFKQNTAFDPLKDENGWKHF